MSFVLPALDHTRVLGPTVEAIARNKAGIFKAGQPALVGPGVPLPVVQVSSFLILTLWAIGCVYDI